jgi:Asp-tRNA(Asn)/Glu-tRNA(Gln) amidotransferase A subunit family amidase
MGVPCVSLPFGAGPAGLPLAVQLVGAAGTDLALLRWSEWAGSVLSPQA